MKIEIVVNLPVYDMMTDGGFFQNTETVNRKVNITH